MRTKSAIVAATVVIVALSLFCQTQLPVGTIGAQEPREERLEYKVIYSRVPNLDVKEAREVEGKVVEIDHGPAAAAAKMTQQYNELAEKGWVFVRVVGETGDARQGDGSTGLLTLFERKKK